MKHKTLKSKYIFYMFTLLIIFFTGCNVTSIIPINPINPIIPIGPPKGTILIESGADTTLDRFPALTIHSAGAAYMSFSGNGKKWSGWIDYSSFLSGV